MKLFARRHTHQPSTWQTLLNVFRLADVVYSIWQEQHSQNPTRQAVRNALPPASPQEPLPPQAAESNASKPPGPEAGRVSTFSATASASASHGHNAIRPATHSATSSDTLQDRQIATGKEVSKSDSSSAPADEAAALNAARPLQLNPRDMLHVAINAGKAWVSHRAASKGAALALYTLFSLAPMLVLVVAIAGAFFGEERVRELLLEQIGGLTGTQGAEGFKAILSGTQKENSGWTAGLISAGLVLVSATAAFSELKDSLDELWDIPPSDESGLWNMVRERFLSFGMVLVLALMALTSLAVSTGLAALGNLIGGIGSEAFHTVMQIVSSVFSFLIIMALFAVIFKYLPATRISWKDVIVGAALTAILFIVGKFLISLYLAKGDIASTYGAAGSVVALIMWIYYSAQIFFYGGLFTHEYALTLGSRANSLPDRGGRPGEKQGIPGRKA